MGFPTLIVSDTRRIGLLADTLIVHNVAVNGGDVGRNEICDNRSGKMPGWLSQIYFERSAYERNNVFNSYRIYFPHKTHHI